MNHKIIILLCRYIHNFNHLATILTGMIIKCKKALINLLNRIIIYAVIFPLKVTPFSFLFFPFLVEKKKKKKIS